MPYPRPDVLPARWYLTPRGRIVRAALGLPVLAGAAWAFMRHTLASTFGGIALTYIGASLPCAAVVQEPD